MLTMQVGEFRIPGTLDFQGHRKITAGLDLIDAYCEKPLGLSTLYSTYIPRVYSPVCASYSFISFHGLSQPSWIRGIVQDNFLYHTCMSLSPLANATRTENGCYEPTSRYFHLSLSGKE